MRTRAAGHSDTSRANRRTFTAPAISLVISTSSIPPASITSASLSFATHTPTAPASSSSRATSGLFAVFKMRPDVDAGEPAEAQAHVALECIEIYGQARRVQVVEVSRVHRSAALERQAYAESDQHRAGQSLDPPAPAAVDERPPRPGHEERERRVPNRDPRPRLPPPSRARGAARRLRAG